MSSHIGRAYLNSCFKVPIDPCNNCPAPFFNRPKMYLGCLSGTPRNTETTTAKAKHCNATGPETKWSCGGVRSLAKLYDSIPDYADLNHLSGEEFYITLNSLRSTCRELKVKTSYFSSEDQCSSSTVSSSLTSSIGQLEGGRSKKNKKSKKKKKSSESKSSKNNHDTTQTDLLTSFSNSKKSQYTKEPIEINERSSSLSRSSMIKDLDKEVESFKKSLHELEAELKRPRTLLNNFESRPQTGSSSKECVSKTSNYSAQNTMKKVPVRSTLTSTLRERLRKSLSFNDLHSLTEPPELEELKKQNKMLDLLSFKVEKNTSKDKTKLSNYFKDNPKLESTEIPTIIVNSPETEKLSNDKQPRVKCGEYKMSFKLFNLDTNRKEKSIQHSTPSPEHPVARPNLAATLRVESSKKKVQELKNNCTFHDTTSQYDWEVRKTPAWKTLSFNETHKQILQLRLATRKAEQALQQREYELNMELMRQRVKSAPLLLEGPTHWGPNVGKLTHTCQKEGRRHLCQRTKRRKNSSRGYNCRRRLFSTTSTLAEENFDNSSNTFRIQANSSEEMSHKLNALRKIYGGSSNIAKSHSRNSGRTTNTQQSFRSQKRIKTNNMQKKERENKIETNFETVEIDSGDELSSLDRAFL